MNRDHDHARAGRILQERAKRLASPLLAAGEEDTIEVLEFGLADERYALEAHHVRDVQPLRELTTIPCTPPFLRGVVSIRGRLVSVIDLKRFFDLPERGITDLHRVVLIGNAELEVGLLADTVEGVFPLELKQIQASLPTLNGVRGEFLRGVTADRLVVLEPEAILSDPRIIIEEDVDT